MIGTVHYELIDRAFDEFSVGNVFDTLAEENIASFDDIDETDLKFFQFDPSEKITTADQENDQRNNYEQPCIKKTYSKINTSIEVNKNRKRNRSPQRKDCQNRRNTTPRRCSAGCNENNREKQQDKSSNVSPHMLDFFATLAIQSSKPNQDENARHKIYSYALAVARTIEIEHSNRKSSLRSLSDQQEHGLEIAL